MFGTYRFFLATLVMLDHLPGGLVPGAGPYAVFAFYLLSGYLMTLVLNQTYGFSADGIRRFVVNRVLRIYPPYLAALLVAMLAYLVRYRLTGQVPAPLVGFSWLDQLGQALLVDLPGKGSARWITPAWSLDVEVAYYLALVFLARSRRVVFLWLAASLGVLAFQILQGQNFLYRYFTFAAASLPFSIGSALYHVRDHLPRPTRLLAVAATALFALNITRGSLLWHDRLFEGFYASLVLALLVTITLRDAKALQPSARFRRVDSRLGDLAYPLFLCHHAVWLVVNAFVPPRFPNRIGLVIVSVSTLSVLLAWGLHQAVEAPIAKWRDRVRPARPERDEPAVTTDGPVAVAEAASVTAGAAALVRRDAAEG